MANGFAVRGLIDIVQQSGAELVGVGIAVEKGFQPGGQSIRDMGINVHSLAIIDEAEPGHIVFRGEA